MTTGQVGCASHMQTGPTALALTHHDVASVKQKEPETTSALLRYWKTTTATVALVQHKPNETRGTLEHILLLECIGMVVVGILMFCWVNSRGAVFVTGTLSRKGRG
eukprot:scaffold425_cov175-Amphora_coffeaeformis.AAC.12